MTRAIQTPNSDICTYESGNRISIVCYLEKSISTIPFQLSKECTTKTRKQDNSILPNERVLSVVTLKNLKLRNCANGHVTCMKSTSSRLQLEQNNTAIHLFDPLLASNLRVKQRLEETPTLLFLQD